MVPGLRTYPVNSKARKPLVDFMVEGLTDAGCNILHCSPADRAPFVVVFETNDGERMGVVAYAFLATRTPTKNRPEDERSFQIKYGNKNWDENIHELWHDPLGMFTTLLIGVDPEDGFFVSADPIVHSPTKFFIRLEFKDEHACETLKRGWYAWERVKRRATPYAVMIETLVGAKRHNFLELVRFERASRGLSPGNRLILAEKYVSRLPKGAPLDQLSENPLVMADAEAHPLAQQFNLTNNEVMDLIASARRLKMAVRGWVAEEHLRIKLSALPRITHCERLDEEGGPDLRVSYNDGPLLSIECKNVARSVDKFGNPKIDFQRTRASKGDPCSRFYKYSEFDVVAACLHSVTNFWDFKFILPEMLPLHKICHGRISNNIRVDSSWSAQAEAVLKAACAAKK